jgi:hypothetical protein
MERLDFSGRKVLAIDAVSGITYIGEGSLIKLGCSDARYELTDFTVCPTQDLLQDRETQNYQSAAAKVWGGRQERQQAVKGNYHLLLAPGKLEVFLVNCVAATPIIDLDARDKEPKPE